MIKWVKGQRHPIGKRNGVTIFWTSEFNCKCALPNCPKQKIDNELIQKLMLIREALTVPIYVSSGFRCEDHNKNVGGSPRSQHVLGKAADIFVKDCSMDELLTECEKHFKAIGVASNFIHVDLRDDKERRWTYGPKT